MKTDYQRIEDILRDCFRAGKWASHGSKENVQENLTMCGKMQELTAFLDIEWNDGEIVRFRGEQISPGNTGIIEIKVRLEGDVSSWESKDAVTVRALAIGEATAVAQAFLTYPVKEVRWNWRGHPQGHYVS